jgi:hypothetical protein
MKKWNLVNLSFDYAQVVGTGAPYFRMNINSTQLLFSKEYMHISLDQINENAEFG